jgi:hypothetical protein|tara:strand:+ start:535 stop:1059 length:525 start_codon:yes stop_codon:yes gene_type:complete
MAGSLVLIDSETVTGAVASVTLGGTNWDSSYDVYKVVVNNLECDTNNKAVSFRFLDSSNATINTGYSLAFVTLKANTSFSDDYGALTHAPFTDANIGTGTGEQANGIVNIFSANNASEYTHYTQEISYLNNSGVLTGNQGGGNLTSAEVTKGVSIFMSGGNIDKGDFKLYGYKK